MDLVSTMVSGDLLVVEDHWRRVVAAENIERRLQEPLVGILRVDTKGLTLLLLRCRCAGIEVLRVRSRAWKGKRPSGYRSRIQG